MMIVDDLDDFHCKWVNDILKRIMLKHRLHGCHF